MTDFNASLTTSADLLYREMQKIFESRPAPLTESCIEDFYKLDREALGAAIAPGGKWLWLLHPSGTHLGEVGILPEADSVMSAALKTYGASHAKDSLALYSISLAKDVVDGRFKAAVRPITIEAGQSQLRSSSGQYRMQKEALLKEGKSIATVSVRANEFFRPDRGYSASIVSEAPLSRLDAIAARTYANRIAATMAGRFVSDVTCTVDGEAFDESFPPIVIAPASSELPATAVESGDGDASMSKLADAGDDEDVEVEEAALPDRGPRSG